MQLLLTILVVLALLLANELWSRTHKSHNELSRKIVHITVGSFVAFWPFFLSWNEIKLLSISFVVAVSISKYLNIFKAIHSVARPTWGEIFFALAVGLVAIATEDKWIYMAALLQMSLADGLAAVIGFSFGKKTNYRILGHTKSVLGTLAFVVVSILILVAFTYFSGLRLAALTIVALALGASFIENIGVRGLDNLLVPLFIASLLVVLT